MPHPPYCAILLHRHGLSETDLYKLAPRHYDEIKNALDARETGWRAFELYEHPSGETLVRMEDIVAVLHAPAEWVTAREQLTDEEHAEKKARGLLD